jgi:hypothetical protein
LRKTGEELSFREELDTILSIIDQSERRGDGYKALKGIIIAAVTNAIVAPTAAAINPLPDVEQMLRTSLNSFEITLLGP